MPPQDLRRYWDGQAAGYDRAMALLGGPLPAAIDGAVAAVAGKGRVLELACGTGLVTVRLAAVVDQLDATDFSAAMVAQTRARLAGRPGVRCWALDVGELVPPDVPYDAVVAANVLHLLPDLDGALARMRAVLAPGGLLVVPTYCHAETWLSRGVSAVMGAAGFPGQRRFTVASLAARVGAAGFVGIEARRIPGLLPIGLVVARRPSAAEGGGDEGLAGGPEPAGTVRGRHEAVEGGGVEHGGVAGGGGDRGGDVVADDGGAGGGRR